MFDKPRRDVERGWNAEIAQDRCSHRVVVLESVVEGDGKRSRREGLGRPVMFNRVIH